jgi:DNA-binding beta-propeller fold protein YncE
MSPMAIQPGTVNAPDFPEGLDWLNIDRPISLTELSGKICLLDFWTYCCINCMHVLPDLKRLEKKYSEELIIIGVHTPKFTTERETENIRQAIIRYGIEHPIVNDHSMQLWREYAVRAWPTLVLVDPLGKVVGAHSGEGVYEVLDPVIAQMVEHFDKSNVLDRRIVPTVAEGAENGLLSFPGKILASPVSNSLFVSDSNHNRVLILSLDDLQVKEVVGSGAIGFDDGDFGKATFHHPQGMALTENRLFVADTENHALREINLKTKTVGTVAGNGTQSRKLDALPGDALGRPLNSPWDLEWAHGVLFIAMAGSHQIWGFDPESGIIAGHAGSGLEDHLDGPLLAAALAQPSGLSSNGNVLFIADSEVSSVRTVDLDPRGGHVKTVVGKGLFDYGDIDGLGDTVRLQHPLDVEHSNGLVYVADTYNHKIKVVHPTTGKSLTLAGTGEAGLKDGPLGKACFYEPSGLSATGKRVFVADTNNHAIRIIDLEQGLVSTLQIQPRT